MEEHVAEATQPHGMEEHGAEATEPHGMEEHGAEATQPHGMEERGKQIPRLLAIAVVATLGLISAAFGFGAEATKPQPGDIRGFMGDGCYYPSINTPFSLGATAIVALFIFRVYCPGIRSSSSVVLLSRYLSWAAWFASLCFYIIGILMLNNQGQTTYYRELDVPDQGEGQYSGIQTYYVCSVVKPGIFGAGASFALTSIMFEIIFLVVTLHGDKTTFSDPSTKLSAVP